MGAAFLVFGLVFVAELGDKSQLLALSFATRHRALPVAAGMLLGTAAIQTLSVVAGGALGAVVSGRVIAVVAGAAFLGFASLAALEALRAPDDADAEVASTAPRAGAGLILRVAGAIFLAEFGDKTMVATVALAARHGPLVTWVGAVAGMGGAGLVGVAVGRLLGRRLPQRALGLGAAALFAAFGIAFLWGALAG